jgi:hypothetical protein
VREKKMKRKTIKNSMSLRGVKRRGNLQLRSNEDCFASLAMTGIFKVAFLIIVFMSVSYGASESPAPPAGAIELVTIPKRENVQLTIYNSADLTLVRERRNIVVKKAGTGCSIHGQIFLSIRHHLTLSQWREKVKSIFRH